MIQLLRVDHRLLHGQVVFSWVKNLQSNCILIANDKVVNDEVYKTTLKLAKPEGCKLVINITDSINAINSGVTSKYDLIIIVSNIKDAYELAVNCNLKSINLGGTKATENTQNISKAVNVTEEEIELLDKLYEKSIAEVFQRRPYGWRRERIKVYDDSSFTRLSCLCCTMRICIRNITNITSISNWNDYRTNTR